MKRLLSSAGWAALGVLAYLFLPDALRAMAAWPWEKIAAAVGIGCAVFAAWWTWVVLLVGGIKVGSAIIRIADKIAPEGKK